MKKPYYFPAAFLLAACSSVPDMPDLSGVSKVLDITPYLDPYRMDIRQGNLVSQEMAAQLKPGLTKDQVRFILGTPLLTDIFHADRWDYVYRLQSGRSDAQQRRLVVYFQDGKLVRVDGDVVGGDAGAAAQLKPATRVIEIKAPEAKPAEQQDAAKPEAAASPSN